MRNRYKLFFDKKGKVLIDNCNINNCNIGILAENNNLTNAAITNNTISVNFPVVAPYGPNKAISISPATPAASGITFIDNNTISGGDVGIELNMVENAQVTNNVIHFQPSAGIFLSPGYARDGIYIFGGQANNIKTNSIKGTAGAYTAGTRYFGSSNEEQYGITTITSPANSITCNNTGDLYSAFHFAGANLNTNLSLNNLNAGNNFVTGIFMQGWAGGGGIISQQGTTGASPHFNAFDGNYNYPGGYKTVCDGSTDGSLSPFLYASSTPATPTPNGGPLPITIFGTASPSYATVFCVPPLRISGNGNTGSTDEPLDQSSLQWAFAVAPDTLYDTEVFADFLKFQSQTFLYSYLADRPALRSAYGNLNAFYNNTLGSPIAALYTADSIIRVVGNDTTYNPSGDSIRIVAAIAQLGGIGNNAAFAGLEAEVRSLSWGKMLLDSAYYDSVERARLEYIASLCPGTNGMAVYMARNLVRSWKDTLYSDDTACAGTGGSMMRTTSGNMWAEGGLPAVDIENAANPSKMVPNPAAGSTRLFVQHPLEHNTELKVYDLNGRIIQRFTLPKGIDQLSIDISKMPAGMYLYSNEDASIKGKLVVQ